MAVVWYKTNYPNIRYYEHESRKTRNGQPDKYYTIRFQHNKKRMEEGLGWASEGWSAAKAHGVLASIKQAIKTGSGPMSLAQLRAQSEQERRQRQKAMEVEAARSITLRQFFEQYYLPRAMREKRSWKTDAQRIAKHINPALGDTPFQALRKQHVQAFVDELNQHYRPATVEQYMAIIRRAYSMAADTLLEDEPLFTGVNPTRGLRLEPVFNGRRAFVARELAPRLIYTASLWRSMDLHDAIVLSIGMGFRLGELMRLSWSRVSFDHNFVDIPQLARRKTGGIVPMNRDAREVLERRFRERKNEMVFPPIYGAIRNLSEEFKNLTDALEINYGLAPDDRENRIVFHSLRHTFGSWLAIDGTDPYRIMQLMRHSDIKMTMRYAHLMPDHLRQEVERLSLKGS